MTLRLSSRGLAISTKGKKMITLKVHPHGDKNLCKMELLSYTSYCLSYTSFRAYYTFVGHVLILIKFLEATNDTKKLERMTQRVPLSGT